MRGGSQAAMVRTDRGLYVVKWKQNPQHRRVLVNEAIAAELLRRLGVAADWAMVHADRRFLESNPEAQIFLKNDTISVEIGWHFGSKVPVDPEKKAIFDLLPTHLMPFVDNLNDFLTVFAFDHWVDNTDGRQAVYFRTPSNLFSAKMIDNGYAFGGSDWRMRDRPVGKGIPNFSEYYASPCADEQFEAAVASIQAIARTEFDAMQRLVPEEWVENDGAALSRLLDELSDRSKRLPDLIALARANLMQRAAR
jgi:hypothetical protein